MMASVSLAGMSCRRADALPDSPQIHVRFARARRTILIITHSRRTQTFTSAFSAAPRNSLNVSLRKTSPLPSFANSPSVIPCTARTRLICVSSILLTTLLLPLTLSDTQNPLISLCISSLFRYSAPLPYARASIRHTRHRRKRHRHGAPPRRISCLGHQGGNAGRQDHARRPGGYRLDRLPALGIANPICRGGGRRPCRRDPPPRPPPRRRPR